MEPDLGPYPLKNSPLLNLKRSIMNNTIINKNDSIKQILDKLNNLLAMHGVQIVEEKTHNTALEKNQMIVTLKEKEFMWSLQEEALSE
jgi:hypothetical protein